MFFRIIKYTENASKYAGLKGIKPVKLSTQNVKKNYGKSSGRALKKISTNTHRRVPWPQPFHWGRFGS
jgi:hypothetical protein